MGFAVLASVHYVRGDVGTLRQGKGYGHTRIVVSDEDQEDEDGAAHIPEAQSSSGMLPLLWSVESRMGNTELLLGIPTRS